MLSKEETAFIEYWEKNRLRRKKTVRQFLLGVPIGLLFVIPIVVNLSSGWYKRADMEANSPDFDPRVLFVALLLIVAFTSIFWQRHKWDQYEQRYRELLARRDRSQAPPTLLGVMDSSAGERDESSAAEAEQAPTGVPTAPGATQSDEDQGEWKK